MQSSALLYGRCLLGRTHVCFSPLRGTRMLKHPVSGQSNKRWCHRLLGEAPFQCRRTYIECLFLKTWKIELFLCRYPEESWAHSNNLKTTTANRQRDFQAWKSYWLSRFKRFFYSQRKTYHKRSECLLRNNNDGLRTKNIPRRTFITR